MTAAEPIAPIHAWVPDLDAARYALAGRGLIDPKPEFREMHLDDVRAVLDASGANAEVESLRALLHAAHHVIATLRAENTDLLEVALQATSAPVDLAAGILRRIAEPAESVAAPGHIDGWQASAELISDPGPDVLSEVVADMARAENEAPIRAAFGIPTQPERQ